MSTSEISQATYVELIYTKVREGKAFAPTTATVENSLRKLAFGEPGPYRDVTPQTPPKLVPQRQIQQYDLSSAPSPTSQALRIQRIAADFNRLMVNAESVTTSSFFRKQDGGPVLSPPFDTTYQIIDIGTPAGLPTPYAGLVFKAGDPNTILVGGSGNTSNSRLYAVPVTRDSNNQIIGLGSATVVANAPYIDGGVAYHPNGVLFVCGYPTNLLHQFMPGNTSPIKTINLNLFGVVASVGSIGFVPVGYPGAGKIRLIAWPSGTAYDVELVADGLGTFDVVNVTPLVGLSGGPEGFIYVPLGSSLFTNPSMMVTEFSTGQVVAYDLDSNGWANPSSMRLIVTGLENAEGAAVDPVTGDFVFSTFGVDSRFYLITGGFVPPIIDDLPSCNKVINGGFDTGISGWVIDAGGTASWDDENGRFSITYGVVFQIITGLTPGSTLSISSMVYWGTIIPPIAMPDGSDTIPVPEGAEWAMRIKVLANAIGGTELGSVAVTNEENTSQAVSLDVTVPASGIVCLAFYNTTPFGVPYGPDIQGYDSPIQIDSVVACESGSSEEVDPCLMGITEVRTLIQWDGVPRKPVNIFNALLRCTFRNPDDPNDKTVVDFLPTTDGRLGTITPVNCSNSNTADFWKQQGVAGTPQSLITATGLNLATTSSITAGLVTSVAGRNNWLWSIPASNATNDNQDALVTLWPDGEDGLLESIEVLYLSQVVTRASTVGAEEQLFFTEATASPDQGQVFGSLQIFSEHAIAAPPALAPSGSPSIAAYESSSGYDIEDRYWRTSPSPLQFTNPGLSDYRSLGSVDFHYTIPTTVPPPYDVFRLVANFARFFESSNNNNSQLLGILVLVNGVGIGGISFPLPLSVQFSGNQDFDFSAISFNIPVNDPITSIVLRITSSYFLSDAGASVPHVDYVPPILKIRGTGATPSPACPNQFPVEDPAIKFDVVIRYRNGRGQMREFRSPKTQTSLYQVVESYPSPPNTWDALVALGNGVKSNQARWESTKFVLDTVNGTGLDQCSEPVVFTTSGRGNFAFNPTLGVAGRGDYQPECEADVLITRINQGAAVNDTQAVILPNPTGGTWRLVFNYAKQTATTEPIAWDATASDVRNALEALSILGAGNVQVTGSGTFDAPFKVEFTGILAARDIRPLIGDGSGLIGASAAVATKITIGTLNERQTIVKGPLISANLRITFNGVQSIAIPPNASLNTMQAALEGISTVGAGTVQVTGNTTDRAAAYLGPWYVDFLSGQNVPAMVPSGGYVVTTNWQGGVGVNDVQKISVAATGGTFKLTVSYPESGSQDPAPSPVTTGDIQWNATADQIATSLLAVCDWLADGDLNITKLNTTSPQEWTIEFAGQWAGKNFPLLTVIGDALQGASVAVQELVKGGGSSEKQKVRLYKAKGGSYRLQVTIAGHRNGTVLIPWDASAEGVELALKALAFFTEADDVAVEETTDRDPDITSAFIVIFGRRFGAVPLIIPVNRLICEPLNLPAVGPPPYDYVLADCDDVNAFTCSSGPLVCSPGEGDEDIDPEACCDQPTIRDTANTYREIILQRELFDPNSNSNGRHWTIRDMAAVKGLKPSLYSAYLRDFAAGTLRPIEITTPISSRMSVVLIETTLDTKATRERITRELQRRPNILPSRAT